MFTAMTGTEQLPQASQAADLSAEIKHAKLRRLYKYWQSKRRGQRLPARADVDPVEFSFALGHIMLIDVVREPLTFRVRLHGSEMIRRVGYEMTGKNLYDLPVESKYRDYVLARCEGLIARPEPLIVTNDRTLQNRLREYEALWLPFSDDGSTVNVLMCALYYSDEA
jgi:hypothetical protein